MFLIILSSLIFGFFLFSLFKYTRWFFFQIELNIKRWMLISLFLVFIGSYLILTVIVNTTTVSGSIISFIFPKQIDILIYIYLSMMLISTIFEVIKLSKKDKDQNEELYKYFFVFSFIKFFSLFLFVSYITALTI